MRQYILRRILYLFPVILGVSFLVFMFIRLLPGDVVMLMLTETPKVKDVAEMRAKLGLDKPIHEQFFIWLWAVMHGDLGNNIWGGRPVMGEILKRLPVTAELAFMAWIVSIVIGVSMGVIAAIRQDTPLDYIARIFNIAGLSTPGFWIATLILILPAVWFGYSAPLGYIPFFDDPAGNMQQFIFPALIIGYGSSASVGRMTRSCMLEVLRQDYIRTAWSKGLIERVVVSRHALKNAMIPVITIIGLQIGHLLSGSVLMEVVFSLPGLGRLTLDSINQRDYTQLQGNILFVSTIYVVMNLVVDITYAWLDPRIRYS